LCRTIIAPAELPVGIITAITGAPVFIWLILKEKRLIAV
jgi:iron complex transport system permease protein